MNNEKDHFGLIAAYTDQHKIDQFINLVKVGWSIMTQIYVYKIMSLFVSCLRDVLNIAFWHPC